MTETTRAASSTYYPALDGLRGVGIFAMLLYHANVGLASGAFLAISMFFTLSGYLIGGQLHAEFERSGRIDFIAFYERRARRLMPAALMGLACAILYALLLAPLGDIRRIAGDVLAALFYVPNWRFVVTGQNYDAIFSDPSPVQHYWSLGVEEQFYLGLPLLFWWVLSRGSSKRLRRVVLAITLASTAIMFAVRVPGAPLGHAYYGTDARVAEVLVGVLLALGMGGGTSFWSARGERAANALAFAVLATSLLLWWTAHETQLWFYRGGALLYAIGSTVTISACVRPGPIQRMFSNKTLVYIGGISYGLYVYHWAIYLALDALDPGWPTALALAIKIALTFAVAAVSHRWLETPIRRRQWFVGPHRLWIPLSAMAAAGLAAGVLLQTAPAGVSSTEVQLALPRASETTGDPGRDAGPLSILVTGDSMSENVGKGLARWGSESGGARFALHSVPACGLAQAGERRLEVGIETATRGSCRAMLRHWQGGVALSSYDVIVLLIGTMDLLDRRLEGWSRYRAPGDPVFDDWFVSVYRDTTDVLLANGLDVVFLTYPCSGSTAYIREKKLMDNVENLIQAAAYDVDRIRHYNEALLPRIVAGRADRVAIVDLFGQVCPGGRFQPGFGRYEEARLDGIHFREEAGRAIADWLGPAILRASGRGWPPAPSRDGAAAQ